MKYSVSPNTPQRRIYSVSEITRSIRSLLEKEFPFIWISGEISNFKRPASGHFYFTLKDKTAQISAVMFRGQNRQLKFDIENGLQINALGRLTVYEPYGNYQIILEYAEPAGLGALQLAFEQLKARLAQEGLFDRKNKQEIPFIPMHISVITSPQGAVIHDIMNVLTRRFPKPVQLIPVNVQGKKASTEIVNALTLVNEQQKSDVIIIARGGGSLEDLQAFNDEQVARSVFRSKIPIVSAIGHETDYTIIDFVADVRAPTPSAAAEMIVPERRELIQLLKTSHESLIQAMALKLNQHRMSLKHLSKRLKSPRRVLEDMRLTLDDRTNTLIHAMNRLLQMRLDHFKRLLNRLIIASPQKRIMTLQKELNWHTTALMKTFRQYQDHRKLRLTTLTARLTTLDPYAILQRGYSVTRKLPEKDVVNTTDGIQPGQHLEVMLASGCIDVIVERIKNCGQKDL